MLYVFRVWFFLQRTLNGQPGDACAGLGYDYRKDTLTNISDGDVRVFFEWRLGYYGTASSGTIALPATADLCREEIDGLGRRDGLDIFFEKPEQLDALNQFALQTFILDLARNNFAK